MDRDHIVRIILEGKNNFSNVVRDMARNADVEFRRLRNQWSQLDRDASRYARTIKNEVNDAHRKSGEVMGALRQRADALAASLRGVRAEREANNRAAKEEFALFGGGTARRGPGGRFERTPTRTERTRDALANVRELLAGVTQGARAAAEIRKQLREQLKLGEDQIETRKAQLREFEKFQKERVREMIDFEKEETEKAIDEINRKKIELDLKRAQELKGIEDRVVREQVRLRIQGEKDVLDAEIRERRRLRARRIQEIRDEAAAELRERKAAISPINEAEVTERVLRESTRAVHENENAFRRLGHTAGRSLGDIGRGFLDGRRGLRALTLEGQRADSIFARLGNTIGRATRGFGTLVNLRWFILISALQLFGTLIGVIGANLVSLASSASLAGAALGGAFAAALGQGIAIMGLFKAAAASLGEVMEAVKLQEQQRLRAGDDAAERAKSQRSAVESLADANWSLKLALEGVSDANDAVREAEEERLDAIRQQRRAVIDLAEARQEATRNIVDANLEEKDAALALEEAELAVLQAKQKLREEESKKAADKTDLEDAKLAVQEANERLRIARAEGDEVEIGAAISGVSLAEQNLARIRDAIDAAETDLQDAQLAVERAELNKKQAVIRDQRARVDAEETRKKGVEGSDQVVAAQENLRQATERVADATDRIAKAERGVRDAVHAVAVARRNQRNAEQGVTDAINDQTAAQKDLQNRLADMSVAERKLFESIVRIRKVYKDNFGPISDIIIGAYQRAVDRAAILLQDPRILAAARRLARAIAAAIDTISKFTLTPEFRRALTQFLDEAAKNVPLLTRALLALLRVFLRLGTAGAPLFRNLLERFVGLVERLEKATRDPQRLERFFAGASRHLDAWLELGKAIGGVVGALVPSAAEAATGPERPQLGDAGIPGGRRGRREAGAGVARGILPFFTEKLRDAQKFFEENPESVTKFFERMNKALQNLAPILGRTVQFLFEAFTSKEATAFSRVILEVVIPGLAGLIKALGLVSRALLFILDIPIIGDIAKFALSFLVFEKALNRIFPVSQKVTNGLKTLVGVIGKGLFNAIKSMSLRPIALLFDGIRLRAMYAKDAIVTLYGNLKILTQRAAEAARVMAQNFITRLKLAAEAAANLGRQALIAARQGLIALAQGARTVATAIAARLLGALRAAATLIRVGLVNAIRLLRANIRLLLLSTGIGALIVAGVLLIEHWDKVKKFAKILADFLLKTFGRIVNWVRDNWKTIAKIIVGIFTFPVGTIAIVVLKFKDKIIGVFKDIVETVKGLFTGMVNFIKEKILGIGRDIINKAKGVISKIKSLNPFGGDDSEPSTDENFRANKILETAAFNAVRPRIKRMRREGMKGQEILNALIEEGYITDAKVNRIAAKQNLAIGGVVGAAGDALSKAVPIIAHAGEWVLNKTQQHKLLNRLNMTAEEAKSWLFGDPPAGQGKAPKKGRTSQSHRGNHFTLTEQIDDDGNSVWFIEMDDGTWGQVSRRSAQRIKATNGAWIPPSVLRSTHGFTKRPRFSQRGAIAAMARGGVVPHFALGGIVGSARNFTQGASVLVRPGQTQPSKHVSQEFNVKAEGTMDWNYIMRLGAMRAQEV